MIALEPIRREYRKMRRPPSYNLIASRMGVDAIRVRVLLNGESPRAQCTDEVAVRLVAAIRRGLP